ncbi:hypothetical protein BZZ01_00435 [Nostocales cyanobacterium HT-58-2]|nr:hypothetical protein BZZ01_00435 [Nostocales cyanobacterium HT-58-2]
MNRLNRFILSFSIVVALTCFLPVLPTHSLPVIDTQVTARDFFKVGVEKILHGNYQQAIKDLTQAIQINADFDTAYSNRCLGYLELQDYHNAIADCTQVINLAPNNAQAYLNRGLAHYRLGDYRAAIADNNEAIRLKHYDFRAYYNRGIASAGIGNYSDAIADYNRALSVIPQHLLPQLADIYNDRGLARFALADTQAAMLDFRMAIRLNANDYRAYFNRGCACIKIGDELGAVSDFTDSLRLNPSHGQAYFNRGITFYQLGYEQAAIWDLQKAAEDFEHKGEKVAYVKTLELIKVMRKQISSKSEIALAF